MNPAAFVGRRFGDKATFQKSESHEALDEVPTLDIMAFPENVFAGILQALPAEQLLNVSRVRLSSSLSSISSASRCQFLGIRLLCRKCLSCFL